MKKQYLQGEIKSEDTGAEIFSGIASTPREDRDGDTIDQMGWELDSYVKNPILLFGHNPFAPPVGKTFNHRVSSDGLEFDFKMAPTPFAQELRTLVKEGFLNTFSVGFIPKDFGDEEKGEKTFTKSELLEISLVSIPSNPDAMVTSRAWKGISSETKQYIMGHIYASKAVVDHGTKTFPIRSEEHTFDVEREKAAASIDDLKEMALWVDKEAPNDPVSYRLIHHASSKEYPIVLSTVKEALKNIDQIPEEDRKEAREHLEKHLQDSEQDEEEKGEKSPNEGMERDQAVAVASEICTKICSDKAVTEELIKALNRFASPDSGKKQASKGRPLGKNEDQKEIMIRALQMVAGSVQKRLCDLKKQRYGKARN